MADSGAAPSGSPRSAPSFASGGPFFSIDVPALTASTAAQECVATGVDHNARAVAQISLIDGSEQPLLNLYVRPEVAVLSYLEPLTGLTAALLEEQGQPLAAAVATLKQALPAAAVLVGTNIRADAQWLGLREGTDFASLVDLGGLFRVWNPQYKSWSVFGQDHLARVLLGVDAGTDAHNAVTDAIKAMRLFNLHNRLRADEGAWAQAQAALLATPPAPSFARRHPSFEGACMGNRKTCTCGGAFLY